MEEMINEARSDERLNRSAVFAARLEALACFINKHDMSGKEAAEALRVEASRIQNEAGDLH